MTESPETSTLRLKPYYVFCTTSLALLILLLAILHPRTSVQVVESQMRVEVTAEAAAVNPAKLQSAIRQFLLDPDQLSQALVREAAELRATYGLSRQEDDQLWPLVVSHLDVDFSGETAAEQIVNIRFGNTSRSTALAVVKQISERFASAFAEQNGLDDTEINVEIADLKQRMAKLQQSRVQLVETRMAEQRLLLQQQAASRDDPRNTQPLVLAKPKESTERSLDNLDSNGAAVDGKGALSPIPLAEDVDTMHAKQHNAQLAKQSPASGSGEFDDSIRTPAQPVASDSFNDSAISNSKTPSEVPEWGPTEPGVALNPPASISPLVPPEESFVASHTPGSSASRELVDSSSDGRGELPQVFELNPQWVEITDQLSHCQNELKEMLQTYTLKHPLANDAVLRIKDLERQLANTPQFLESRNDQQRMVLPSQRVPLPSFSPIPESYDGRLDEQPFQAGSPSQPDFEEGATSASSESLSEDNRPVVVTDTELRSEIMQSEEYSRTTKELAKLQTQLAAAIHHQQLEMTAVRSIRASIETPPRTVGILSKSITLFDLLTYLVPACVLGIGASIVRRPEELPLALCSMADVEHTMSIEVVGAISSPNGPVVPQRAEASPPESILRLVFACEVFCVAAAVVFTIAFFQIPNFSAQFVHNPLAAFVTSVDLVIDFIGSFF